MVQKLLTKYGLVFHVACACLFPLCFVSQARFFNLVPLLWLSLAVAELMFLQPSVRRSETLADARLRVWNALVWDPFLYVGLAVVAVGLLQVANSGCELVYLPDADIWQISAPPLAWAPFSVEPRAALAQLSVWVACVMVGLALRVALGKESKRVLLQTLACMSGAAALFATVQACRQIQPYASLTAGASAPVIGTVFGFWLFLGIGLLADATARYQRGKGLLLLLGVAGNLAGMLFFASAMMICLFAPLALVLAIYGLVYLRPHVPKAMQLKLFLGWALLVAVTVGALVFVFPQNPVADKCKAALPVAETWQALAESRSTRAAAAIKIWQDHAWAGVGADGFSHFVGLTVDAKEWPTISTDQGYVYNDWLQYLCEYGVLGAALFLSAVVVLLVPLCYRARIVWKFGSQDDNEGRGFLLRLSPLVVTGVLASAACLVESFMASPYRSPFLLLSWICVMAALPAFMPARAAARPKGV